VFLALALVLWWKERSGLAVVTVGLLGSSLLLGGLFLPNRLERIYRIWMAISRVLSKVTTPIVMGIMYLAIFSVVGAFMRVLGRNPLIRAAGSGSFWVSRAAGRDRRSNSMERQF
jgi:hypothetical protein